MAYGFNPIRFLPSYGQNATQYSYKRAAPKGWGPPPAWFIREQARHGYLSTGRGRGTAAGRPRSFKKKSSFKRKGKGKKVMRKKKTSLKKKIQRVYAQTLPYRKYFGEKSGNIVYTEGAGSTIGQTPNATARGFEIGSASQAASSPLTSWGTSQSGDLYEMFNYILGYTPVPVSYARQNHFLEMDYLTMQLEFKNNKSFTANAWIVEASPKSNNLTGSEATSAITNIQFSWTAAMGQVGTAVDGARAAGSMPCWMNPRDNPGFVRQWNIKTCKKIKLLPGETYQHTLQSKNISLKNPMTENVLSFNQMRKYNRQLLILVWGDISHDVATPDAVQYASATLDYVCKLQMKGRIGMTPTANDEMLFYDEKVNPAALNAVAQDEMNYNPPILTGIS